MSDNPLHVTNWCYLTELNRRAGEPMIIAPVVDIFLKAKGPVPDSCAKPEDVLEAFRVLYENRYGIWLDSDAVRGVAATEAAEAIECDFARTIALDNETSREAM